MKEYDTLQLLPFLSYIFSQDNNKQALANLKHLLRTSFPQYIDVNKAYFTNKIEYFSNIVADSFISELNKMKIKECSLHGISSKFNQWIPGNILTLHAKKINPNIKIVIGGFGTEKEAIALMQNIRVYDYAIGGEDEYALLGLCKHIENPTKNSLSEVQHLFYRENDILTATKVKSKYLDLNNINPDFSAYFSQEKTGINPDIPIEGSRGCHWRKCKFCFFNSGYKNRCKKIENIISLIEISIEKYSSNLFSFLDNDLINNNLKSFTKLLDALIVLCQKHPKLKIYNAEIITQGLNAEIIKKMSLAGFVSVQIGYEALNDIVLKRINKKNTVSSNILFIKWARQFNSRITSTNIIDEIDSEIIDSTKKLHFLRFYLKKNFLQHSITNLVISSSSQYYKFLNRKNLLNKWNINKLTYFSPKKYINESNKFDIFPFQEETVNPLWNDFEKVENNYLKNSYRYQIIEKDANTLFYQEFCNTTFIKQLELEKDSLHWRILCFCNSKVVSKKEITEYITNVTLKDLA